MRVRVLADDLTGAADAAIAFAGGRPRLALHTATALWQSDQAVVALDTAARDAGAAVASASAARLAGGLMSADIAMKKIDSLLRGPIRAEIQALRTAMPTARIVVAPAFPALGRTTRDGMQHVDGTALGPGRGDLTGLLAPLPTVTVGLSGVRAGTLAHEADAAGEAVICADAETDDDLDAVVAACGRLGGPVLWVGSGGLAHALARAAMPARRPPPVIAAGRFLAVIGSACPLAARQAAALPAQHIDIPVDDLAAEPWAERIGQAVRAGDTVVRVVGPVDPSAAATVSGRLAAVVTPAVADVSLLMLTGGATARAILVRCGCTELELLSETEPGVVLSAPAAGLFPHVLTKAGAFGDDHTLARALKQVRKEKQ